jgi:hypothetical protein
MPHFNLHSDFQHGVSYPENKLQVSLGNFLLLLYLHISRQNTNGAEEMVLKLLSVAGREPRRATGQVHKGSHLFDTPAATKRFNLCNILAYTHGYKICYYD